MDSRNEKATGDGESVRAIVREIVRIARELGYEGKPEQGTLSSSLDSLQLLSLVVAVEDRFRIVLEDADAGAARTIEDLARIVLERADPALFPGAPGAVSEVPSSSRGPS